MAAYPTVPLRAVCESIEYGYTASATTEPVGPRFLRITDIVPERLDWEKVPFCDIEPQKLAKHRLRTGDIVIARTGATTGWAKFIKDPPEAVFASYLVRVRPAASVDARFVGFVVESPVYKDFIQQHMGGAAQPNANAEVLTSYDIPIPPLPVQRRIASILSAYDELIENSLRRIRLLEAMARALYREWFVYFRFPGHEEIPQVASLLGDIPEGWEVKKLAEVADVNRTQINARSAPDELHYIDISSVSPGRIDAITTYAFVDAPGRARRIVQHGDVIWSCVRPNRRSHAQVMHPEPNTVASTGFAVLTATKVPFTFLYLATTTDDVVAYLTNNATGAAYPAVTATTFQKADLLIPPAPLLKTFGDATIPIAEQIHTLQRQIQNLRRTRDLLLPRLLSGRIEVQAS
jgi:type I restriction enzyme S subunit